LRRPNGLRRLGGQVGLERLNRIRRRFKLISSYTRQYGRFPAPRQAWIQIQVKSLNQISIARTSKAKKLAITKVQTFGSEHQM